MSRRTSIGLLGLAYLGFLSLGLPDGLLGVAWPEMRVRFALPQGALGALFAVATSGYMLASFAAGWLLRRMRIGGLLALSCLATAASLLGYAWAPAWAVLVAFGSLAGLGAGAIDAGINAYVASQHGPRTVNWLHACYGVGAASGPALMSAMLMRGLGWQGGYAVAGLAQLGLAVAFAATYRAWPATQSGVGGEPDGGAPLLDTLRLATARWSIAAFFVYTGVEAAAGAWSYSLLALGRGFEVSVAALWVSGFWTGLTLGRVAAGALAGRLRPQAILGAALAGLGAAAACIWLAPVRGAELVGVAALGLAAGPIFPTLIATTRARVGPTHAANAVGFQIAFAAFGQSLYPAAIGLAAGAFGLEIVGPALLAGALALSAVAVRLAQLASQEPAESVPSSARRTLARAR